MARDATCAAAARISNTLRFTQSSEVDIRHLRVLIAQIRNALIEAGREGSLRESEQAIMKSHLERAEADLTAPTLREAGLSFKRLCDMFE